MTIIPRDQYVETNLQKFKYVTNAVDIPESSPLHPEYARLVEVSRVNIEHGCDPKRVMSEFASDLNDIAQSIRQVAERVSVSSYDVYRLPADVFAEALGVSRGTFLKIRREHGCELPARKIGDQNVSSN